MTNDWVLEEWVGNGDCMLPTMERGKLTYSVMLGKVMSWKRHACGYDVFGQRIKGRQTRWLAGVREMLGITAGDVMRAARHGARHGSYIMPQLL